MLDLGVAGNECGVKKRSEQVRPQACREWTGREETEYLKECRNLKDGGEMGRTVWAASQRRKHGLTNRGRTSAPGASALGPRARRGQQILALAVALRRQTTRPLDSITTQDALDLDLDLALPPPHALLARSSLSASTTSQCCWHDWSNNG